MSGKEAVSSACIQHLKLNAGVLVEGASHEKTFVLPVATVRTDSPEGKSGALTVKSLTVKTVKKPAGTYTADTEKWIDGKGKVVVAP